MCIFALGATKIKQMFIYLYIILVFSVCFLTKDEKKQRGGTKLMVLWFSSTFSFLQKIIKPINMKLKRSSSHTITDIQNNLYSMRQKWK